MAGLGVNHMTKVSGSEGRGQGGNTGEEVHGNRNTNV